MTARQSRSWTIFIFIYEPLEPLNNVLFEGTFEWWRGVCLLNPYLLNQGRYVSAAVRFYEMKWVGNKFSK